MQPPSTHKSSHQQSAIALTSRSFTMLGWSNFLSTAISRTTSFGVLPLIDITLDRRSGLPSVAGVAECRFSSCRGRWVVLLVADQVCLNTTSHTQPAAPEHQFRRLHSMTSAHLSPVGPTRRGWQVTAEGQHRGVRSPRPCCRQARPPRWRHACLLAAVKLRCARVSRSLSSDRGNGCARGCAVAALQQRPIERLLAVQAWQAWAHGREPAAALHLASAPLVSCIRACPQDLHGASVHDRNAVCTSGGGMPIHTLEKGDSKVEAAARMGDSIGGSSLCAPRMMAR